MKKKYFCSNKMERIREKVQKYIHLHGLLKDNARVLVGLSGGPDSVCLISILNQLGYEVIAVHCNFHLRGEESLRDELFSEQLCKQYGLAYHKVDFDTTLYAKEHKISIEMAARELRYDAFRLLKAKWKAEAIAVGHHKDDNIETFLLNLSRGTGIKGLCGMQPKNDDVIRPLLCLTRQEILEHLRLEGLEHMTDHTNLEDDYARNKVRLNVLPLLESINKGAMHNITSTIENLNEVQNVYRQAISAAIKECCIQKENGETHIIINRLLQQASPISVLHELLSPIGFNKQQLKDVLASLNESSKIFMSQGRRLLIDRNTIILESLSYPSGMLEQEELPIEKVLIKKDPHIAYLDADKLHGPLTLRTPQTGDTFAPFGMKGKRKLLSDYLTDLKLNLFEKERQLLLMDGDEIAWVVNRRSSELYRVDETTRRVIVLTWT